MNTVIVERGLFCHQVLQHRREASDQSIVGRSGGDGDVLATVTHQGRIVRGFGRRRIGTARAGRFTARLAGLGVGGPYRIVLRVGGESLTTEDVLVGDVWLLGGQSNMQGYGLLADAPRPDPLVRCHYHDDTWAIAAEPLHRLWLAVDPVHHSLGAGEPRATGTGPGLAFALEMRRLTGVPQGVIACAHGGTSIPQWSPAGKGLGGDSLYGAMLRRLARDGGSCAGLAWYQGEDETGSGRHATYGADMARWIRALRRDLRSPRLPVVMCQLGHTDKDDPDGARRWNAVQEQQRLLPSRVAHLSVVPTVDLGLDDTIHISGRDHRVLGARLAQAMHVLRGGRLPPARGGRAQIVPRSITVVDVLGNGFLSVRVRFSNVCGRLVADGPATGFAVGARDGSGGRGVSRCELQGDSVLIHTTRTAITMPGSALWYGRGFDPVCTIHDAAGRSLPVFGPLLIAPPLPLSPFLGPAEISAFQPGASDLSGMAYPADPGALGFAPRIFPGGFANLRDRIVAHGKADAVVWWRLTLRLTQAMPIRLLFGYDGPVRLWLDREALYHDPHGTNPARPDGSRLPVRTLTAGDHEVVVALGTNHGRAWGIWLRARRQAVRPSMMARGEVALPRWV